MKKAVLVLPSYTEDAYGLFKEYFNYINMEFDILFLCKEKKDRILKKDVDLTADDLQGYSIICPVGAESLKYTPPLLEDKGMTGIMKYNGVLIEELYFPIISPNLVEFKPQYKEEIFKAFVLLRQIVMDSNEVVLNFKDYRFIDNCQDFEEFLEEMEEVDKIVVDIETTSLSPRQGNILGVVLSCYKHQGVYITAEVFKQYLEEIQDIFNEKTAIFHNAKFDMKFLKYEYKLVFPKFEDTMIMHYVLDESTGTHGLKGLAMKFTDLGDYERDLDEFKKEFCRKSKIKLADFNYGMIPTEILSEYGCRDGDATYQLFSKFHPIILRNDRFNRLYYDILLPTLINLMEMEDNGGPICKQSLNTAIDEIKLEIEDCLTDINNDENILKLEDKQGKPFNPNSVKQLGTLLFDIIGLTPIKRTATGAASTDAEVLSMIDHPIAEAILDLRKKNKLLNTYLMNILNGMDDDDRLRSNFNLHGTTSGRLSSSGVLNYQNIPRDIKLIKEVFKARPGYKIVQCDLGTAEVYYAAVLSNDRFLQQAFVDKLDFHSYVAKRMFNLPCEVSEIKTNFKDYRQISKAITFGIMYQAGPYKIAETVNADCTPGNEISVQEAKDHINTYFREAKDLKLFINNSNKFIENNAYIYSYYGRKRRLPESKSKNKSVAGHAVRSGVNFLIQSIASDINIMGFNDLMDWIRENNYEKDILPFTLVHDSIVSEVREDLVEEYIENTRKFLQKDRGLSIPNAPIKVDFGIGDTWAEANEE